MIQFYAPEIKETHALPEMDSGHCIRVLRMTAGHHIRVVDGRGGVYECVITDPNPKQTTVDIVEETVTSKLWQGKITIGIAPPKNIDRFEWFVEKATELGVDQIVPIRCARSERKDVRHDRIEKVIIAAMKQSLQAYKPTLFEMTPLAEFLKLNAEVKGIGYCDANIGRRDFVDIYRPCTDVNILIGPEGDFTEAEVDASILSGFTPIVLGPTRLRTETAALTAVDTVHIVNRLNNIGRYK